MKKFILSLGLVAMMLNLTNCAQYEDVNPTVNPQGDFELFASISRTANDGLNTVWEADDQINIFHAEAGTTNYLNDTPYANSSQNPFVCEDATTGRFLGKLLGGALEESKSYDWYAFYPYSSYITTPANTSNGYMPVGAKSGVAQTQNGNNSMAHLAGGNYPLAGVAKAVAAGTAPTVAMKNLTSVLEFEVTNSLAEAITISEISFTAPVDINGTYYINFVDLDNVEFTGSGANYVSKTATLKVENGTAIAAGASAKFYLAVKPFTAAVGNELNISVAATSETGSGTHNKTITLDKEVVFSAGKIKTVKVDYTTVIEKPAENEVTATLSFADKAQRTSYSTTQQVWQQNGIVFTNSKSSSTTNVGDYSNPARCYKGSSIEVTAPGNISKIVFKANTNSYATELKTSIGTVSGAEISVIGTKVTIEYSTPVANVAIAKLVNQVRLNSLTVTYISGGETPEVPATPILSVDPATVEVVAAGGNAEFGYTVTNPADGVSISASTTATWINNISSATAGKVTFTVAENTATQAREAKITLAYTGAESKTVTVKQAAAESTEDTKTYTFSSYTAGTQYAEN